MNEVLLFLILVIYTVLIVAVGIKLKNNESLLLLYGFFVFIGAGLYGGNNFLVNEWPVYYTYFLLVGLMSSRNYSPTFW